MLASLLFLLFDKLIITLKILSAKQIVLVVIIQSFFFVYDFLFFADG